MNAITETVDKPDGVCQQAGLELPFSENEDRGGVGRRDIALPKTSSKFSHGGPRANSGGARPNCGGPQPGSGRPRKIQPIAPTQISYAIDTPLWCVIAFWGQAEVSATTELSRIGYETCMPLRAIRRQDPVLTSLWHTVRVPLFSGYGFIRLTQSESREPIQATRGIREILRRPDGKAAWVPDGLIERLIADAPKRLELPKEHAPVLAVGSKIRVKDGTFGGHRGVVVECDGVSTKVDIEMFGRMVPVWMDRVGVEVVA